MSINVSSTSPKPAAFDLAVDDDPRRYQHLSTIRLEDPDAVARAAKARRRHPGVKAGQQNFIVAADHPARGALAVGSDPVAMADRRQLLDRLQIDPTRQLIASQCSGALLVARLGLLGDAPACTDSSTRPWLVEAGVRVLDEPFHARGPVATSGGCLASQYLSAWIMWSKAGESAARDALAYAAPVGEKDEYVERLLARVRPFMPVT